MVVLDLRPLAQACGRGLHGSVGTPPDHADGLRPTRLRLHDGSRRRWMIVEIRISCIYHLTNGEKSGIINAC